MSPAKLESRVSFNDIKLPLPLFTSEFITVVIVFVIVIVVVSTTAESVVSGVSLRNPCGVIQLGVFHDSPHSVQGRGDLKELTRYISDHPSIME